MAFTLPGNIKTTIKRIGSDSRLPIIFGCLVISAWTLIRFFDQGPSFDQVGQQVLAHQWLHGLHSGAVIGPTNYVLKMLFLYMPLDLVPLSAQAKLIFMTLLVNLLTFLLLMYVLTRLWKEFYPNRAESLNLPMVYLALLSGSIFWISFANSRNLEVVGGVYLIYLYIRAQARQWRYWPAGLILAGTILFFADPLQIYMSLLPALLFIGLRVTARPERQRFNLLLKKIACALISIALAHILARLVESIWNVSFISTNSSAYFQLSSLRSAAVQLTKLYAGGFEGGRAREVLNLLVVAGVMSAGAYYIWHKAKTSGLLVLAVIVWITDLAVFIISGQAAQSDTNRYLIMTAPFFVLVLADVLYRLRSMRLRTYVVAFVLLFNSLTLGIGFAKAWNPHFSHNDHDRAAISYFKSHSYTYGYASIGTALSGDYLSNSKINLLPLGCDPDYVLKKTNLFFDKAAFNIANPAKPGSLVPVVLDGNNITVNSSTCGVTQIAQQLGQAAITDHLSDGSTVLLYKTVQLENLRQVSN